MSTAQPDPAGRDESLRHATRQPSACPHPTRKQNQHPPPESRSFVYPPPKTGEPTDRPVGPANPHLKITPPPPRPRPHPLTSTRHRGTARPPPRARRNSQRNAAELPERTGQIPTASRAAASASTAGAAMEVASSSPSPSPTPPSSKPALRLNPAAVLLRRLPTPTPTTSTPVTASASPPQPKPLTAFLSSLLPRRKQRPRKKPDPAASASTSAARKAAKAAAQAEAEARQLVGCAVPLFRPYVAQLPWHGGARAWLSKLFPRYGHYCGPNWSSGKEAGSVLWDRRPVDHLDFCCYCHDMAYDTHDQAQLLRADLAFLRCLEGSRQTPSLDGVAAAAIYRSMCIFGLKTILIPYRTNLVRLQTGPNYADAFADFVKRVASSSGRPTGGEKQRL